MHGLSPASWAFTVAPAARDYLAARRSIRLRAIDAADADLWNTLARATHGGTAFHDWGFLDLQQRLLGVHVERLLVESAGVPVGVFPLLRRGRRSLLPFAAPFPFLGPAVPADLLVPTFRALRRWQAAHAFPFARFALAPEAAAALAGTPGLPLRLVPDTSVSVDLSHGSTDALRAGFSRQRRRSLKAAAAAGAWARAAAPGETTAMLGRVLTAAYGRRDAASPYPATIGAQVEQWAEGRADVYLGAAFVGERHVGSIVVLGAHETALAWIGACLPEFRDAHPSDPMHLALLDWAIARRHRAVDFSGRVDGDVRRYKLSFGGTEVPAAFAQSLLGDPRLLRRRDQSAPEPLRMAPPMPRPVPVSARTDELTRIP